MRTFLQLQALLAAHQLPPVGDVLGVAKGSPVYRSISTMVYASISKHSIAEITSLYGTHMQHEWWYNLWAGVFDV